MSTIPKDIKEKIERKYSHNTALAATRIEAAEYGYSLATTSTDGRELEKEIDQAKKRIILVSSQYSQAKAQITALQSSLKEKEEVNRGLQNACKKWETICEELKAENERLKGVIDGGFNTNPNNL